MKRNEIIKTCISVSLCSLYSSSLSINNVVRLRAIIFCKPELVASVRESVTITDSEELIGITI